MKELELVFPVACPLCRCECLCRLPVALIAGAMLTKSPLTLKSGCHPAEWPATRLQTEQIREYFQACFGTPQLEPFGRAERRA
jgi:hypothetical protein